MTTYTINLLRCADGSLYAGIARDLVARIALRNRGAAMVHGWSYSRVTCARRSLRWMIFSWHADDPFCSSEPTRVLTARLTSQYEGHTCDGTGHPNAFVSRPH